MLLNILLSFFVLPILSLLYIMKTFSDFGLFYLILIRICYIHLFLFLFHLFFGFHFVRITECACSCLPPLDDSLRFLRKILGLDLGLPTTAQVLHILNFLAPLHSWGSCTSNQLVLNAFFCHLDLLVNLRLLGLFIFLNFVLICTQNSAQMKILFRLLNFVIILIKIMALH